MIEEDPARVGENVPDSSDSTSARQNRDGGNAAIGAGGMAAMVVGAAAVLLGVGAGVRQLLAKKKSSRDSGRLPPPHAKPAHSDPRGDRAHTPMAAERRVSRPDPDVIEIEAIAGMPISVGPMPMYPTNAPTVWNTGFFVARANGKQEFGRSKIFNVRADERDALQSGAYFETTDRREILATLISELAARGWEPAGKGQFWYSARFKPPS